MFTIQLKDLQYDIDESPRSNVFEGIDALRADIAANGILVPIQLTVEVDIAEFVRQGQVTLSWDDVKVCDGYRRLICAYQLGIETVPVTIGF